MPMVGYDVRLPANLKLRQIILDIMSADGVSIEHFKSLNTVAATSATGGYRRIVQTPS
jgi:hypothetical protein